MTSAFTIQAADHPIKSVTVFKSSKAEVVRTFSLSLKKGQNKIEIRGLPSTIDTHSVRVSGLGDARLFDIVCTIAKSNGPTFAADGASEVIRALRVKRGTIESEKHVREQEADLLLKYAQTLKGEHVDPTQMSLFLESYVEQGRKNLKARTQLSEKIIEIDRQIEAEKEKTASKRGSTLGRVDIVIVADENSSVELRLTYIVSNAQWTPTYELHATTENGKPSSSVSLHYRARVTQSTGEDWNNTSLTLSTVASDTVVKRIPQLRTIRLRPPQDNTFTKNNLAFGSSNSMPSMQNNIFTAQQQQRELQHMQQQPMQQQLQQRPTTFGGGGSVFGATGGGNLFGASRNQAPQGAFGFGGFGTNPNALPALAPAEVTIDPQLMQQYQSELAGASAMPLPEEDDDFEEVDGPSPLTGPTTIVSETPMAISFSVHGESTIPSDGIDHQVSVAILAFEAKISYITIPRIDPRVFLQCEVENSSEYRLLPGPVTVILDDSYVSKTSINDVNTGDNFECTLGDDASTKVTYSRTFKTLKSAGGAFSEVYNTTTYTTKISIHNKHQFAINDLIVREIIPTCDATDKRAKVVLRKPAKLADTKDGETVEVVEGEGLRVGWEKLVDGKGGEKEGKFEWRWKVGNGAKVNLEAEWEVKVPGEVAWVEGY